MSAVKANGEISPWPHRWAVVLACATFPLVWVGGLVTTTDAGMAVPDWPSTYGYNLFLYPWQSWLAGPWDIFVEHGHRLLGAVVGMITIGLLAVIWRTDDRAWIRWLGVAALALVIFQGVLGGMRVLMDERTLAMLHGCTGPLFFALTVAMAVFTSRRWQDANASAGATGSASANVLSATGSASATTSADEAHWRSQWHPASTAHFHRFAIVAAILVYLQIVLGAVLRHVPIDSEPATFALAVRFHLFLAAILSLHIVVLVWMVLRRVRPIRPLAGLAWMLTGLLTLQLAVGAATWMVKFAAPTWAPHWVTLGSAAVHDGGWLQTHIITTHVALGSLLLGTTLALALYSWRLLSRPLPAHGATIGRLEAAV